MPIAELTAPWRTSSYTVQNEACVEAGATESQVVVRDTKYGHRGEVSPILAVSRSAFGGLVEQIKTGRLDL